MTNRNLLRLLALLMLAVTSACSACRKQTVKPANSSPATSPSPVRAAKGSIDIDKKRVTLADFRGKVVLLDFYATWCEPCRAETPLLVKLHQQYESQGLQVIGLNVGGEDDYDQVPAFAKEFHIQYPLGIPDDDFVDQYLSDNQNIPQSFIFDRNGVLWKRMIGYDPASGELEGAVQAALANPGKPQ